LLKYPVGLLIPSEAVHVRTAVHRPGKDLIGAIIVDTGHLGHAHHSSHSGRETQRKRRTATIAPGSTPGEQRGVVERMSVVGQQVTHAEETVTVRPALASEADRLNMRAGGIVLTIARTYHTSQRPAETANIIIPVERYSLIYEIPVR